MREWIDSHSVIDADAISDIQTDVEFHGLETLARIPELWDEFLQAERRIVRKKDNSTARINSMKIVRVGKMGLTASFGVQLPIGNPNLIPSEVRRNLEDGGAIEVRADGIVSFDRIYRGRGLQVSKDLFEFLVRSSLIWDTKVRSAWCYTPILIEEYKFLWG